MKVISKPILEAFWETHKEAMKRIDELILKNDSRTDQEEDELDVLSDLAFLYEQEHYPLLPPNPIEAIKFRMDQMNLKQ